MSGDLKARPSVLFACDRNAVRSPMAMGLARHLFGPRFEVDSAGVEAGMLDPFAVAAMAERGIDISSHRPRNLGAVASGAALIITLSPESHHHVLDLAGAGPARVEFWPVPDPTLAVELALHREAILESYRKVRDLLHRRILERFSGGLPGAL